VNGERAGAEVDGSLVSRVGERRVWNGGGHRKIAAKEESAATGNDGEVTAREATSTDLESQAGIVVDGEAARHGGVRDEEAVLEVADVGAEWSARHELSITRVNKDIGDKVRVGSRGGSCKQLQLSTVRGADRGR